MQKFSSDFAVYSGKLYLKTLTPHSSSSCIFFFTLLLLLTGFSESALGQQGRFIRGKVTDQRGIPMARSSVYLSHTSKGVTTNVEGEFNLENLPEGKYDLVISAIGYETKIIPITSDSNFANLKIQLSLRSTELAEVVVEPTDKKGWRKYGRYFMDNFIGTTHNARHCTIVNHEIIRFKFSEKNNRLVAKANEPIIIENKMLGYRISFQLIEFTADFNAGRVVYYGHPLFTELIEHVETKQRRILNNRRTAYYGSLMHFMRAAYEDNIKKEGFTIRATVTAPNFERERVKKIVEDTSASNLSHYKIIEIASGVIHVANTNDSSISRDSLRYYRRVLNQRDSVTQRVSFESLNEMIIKVGAYSKFLFFSNTMEVIYNNKRSALSEIMLQTPKPLEIFKNGSYFSPIELITFKYWGEYEKICNMLPFDYYPD